jgi:hypothetical protein
MKHSIGQNDSTSNDPIKVSNPIEGFVNIFVDQIKQNPSKDSDPKTPMGLVQIIYNRFNPKVNFLTGVSQVQGTVTEKNLEQNYFSDVPLTFQKKFQSLVQTLTSPDQVQQDS